MNAEDGRGGAMMRLDAFGHPPVSVGRATSSEESSSSTPLYVTRPLLPPLEELQPLLQEIWERRIVTNAGPVHQRLEAALAEFLQVEHLSLVANATLGLYTALRALPLEGEVITTPFSFVATGHGILAAGLEPVFVDVDPDTYNLDSKQIEQAITPRTSAILPVHCFGRACDTRAIEAIALEHGLEVVYDAAHAFGVEFLGRSLTERGSMSVVSFHATKVFNTLEGGAVVCRNAEMKRRIDQLVNYGYDGEDTISIGMNAKLNEVSCAVGLASLPYVGPALRRRAEIAEYYRSALHDAPGLRVIPRPERQSENNAYFPIEVTEDHPLGRDGLLAKLKDSNIHARRYFFPLLTDLTSISRAIHHAPRSDLPNARRLASRILCLPISPTMTLPDAFRVVRAVRD